MEETVEPAETTHEDYTNRVLVMLVRTQLGKPADPDDPKRRNGVTSVLPRALWSAYSSGW